MPLLLDETAALEFFMYLVAAAGVLGLLLGVGLWWALRDTLKAQTDGRNPATARPGCTAAVVVAVVLGLLLLRLLW